MKILPLSDVHLEFGRDVDAFVNSLAYADVVVIAGDLGLMRFVDQARDALRPFSEKFPNVVYVPGNHEYYKSSPAQVEAVLRTTVQEFHNVHYLRPGVIVNIAGQPFVGNTLWFPEGPETYLGPRLLTDYSAIRGFVPWVYDENTRHRAALASDVCSDSVVVTHHLPSWRSVNSKYQGEKSNMFFVSDEEKLIGDRKPKLWIHGHTHDGCDYLLGETRIVCNPVGYPDEKKPFNPNLIVEV